MRGGGLAAGEPCRGVDTVPVSPRIDIFKYVIYGIAAAFFVYGILLMVEGFFTTGAIKDLYGDFKITTCGRCVSAWVGCLSPSALRVSFPVAHGC